MAASVAKIETELADKTAALQRARDKLTNTQAELALLQAEMHAPGWAPVRQSVGVMSVHSATPSVSGRLPPPQPQPPPPPPLNGSGIFSPIPPFTP